MNIYINDEIAEIKLEKEKTLGEVVKGIEAWALEQKQSLLDIYADSEVLLMDNKEAWADRPLGDVKDLRLEVISPARYALTVLAEAEAYAGKLMVHISRHKQESDLERIAEGLDWLEEAVLKSLTVLNFKDEQVLTEGPIKAARLVLHNWKNGQGKVEEWPEKCRHSIELIVGQLYQLLIRAGLLVLGQDLNMASETEFKRLLTEEFPTIFEILEHLLVKSAENVQIGREFEGLEMIKDIASSLGLLIAAFSGIQNRFNIPLDSIQLESQSLADILIIFGERVQEIETAFSDKDMVFLADLLEYEVVEMLPDLKKGLELISAKI